MSSADPNSPALIVSAVQAAMQIRLTTARSHWVLHAQTRWRAGGISGVQLPTCHNASSESIECQRHTTILDRYKSVNMCMCLQ